MGSGRLPVAALVVGVIVAIGGAVWLVAQPEETLTPPGADPAARARPAEPPARSRSRVRAEPVAAPAPAPPPVSALDRVPPSPDVHAARARERAGGSLAAAVKKLIAPDCGHGGAFEICRDVHWGWGLRGVDAVLAAAAAQLATTGDPRRGVILLGLAQADFHLGDGPAAEEHLVQAVLALQADWAWDRNGLPRLVFLAGGPNVEPWSEADLAAFRKRDARDAVVVSSGAAAADGGAWLIWSEPGEPFFKWTLTLAADDTKPEPAMAASIWTHAVLSRHHWQQLPHGLPAAAAVFRTTDGNDWKTSESTSDDEWRRAFQERRRAAQDADWQKRLADVETRIGAIAAATPDRRDSLPRGFTEVAIWSLSDEFDRRFAKTDTPRAEALRQLAARLVEFDAVEAASEAK